MKRRITLWAVITGLLVGLPSTVVLSKGQPQGKAAASSDPVLMTIAKTGQVLRSTSTTAIFWGGDWNNASVAGDIITGLDTFFAGFGGSHFVGIATEYYDRNGPITSYSTYLGRAIDPSQPPAGALAMSTVIAEACRIVNNKPDPNGVYFVYTSTPATLPGTCALRASGTCSKGGGPIQVVYTPFMTGNDAGCDNVQDTGEVTGHSLALGQYGKVTANQLFNAITDPVGTGWKDAKGYGISFKCDGIMLPVGSYETFSNNSIWKQATKWSNAAYRAGTGLPNVYGQLGCVY